MKGSRPGSLPRAARAAMTVAMVLTTGVFTTSGTATELRPGLAPEEWISVTGNFHGEGGGLILRSLEAMAQS